MSVWNNNFIDLNGAVRYEPTRIDISSRNSMTVKNGRLIFGRDVKQYISKTDMKSNYGHEIWKLEIPNHDVGSFPPQGFMMGSPDSPTQLVINGMRLAWNKYPKETNKWLNVAQIQSPQQFMTSGALPFIGKSRASDIIALGFYKFEWAHNLNTLSSINGNQITLGAAPSYALTTNGYFKLMNIVDELKPGEMAIRFNTGIIYFVPTGPINEAYIYNLKDGMSLAGCQNIVFENISFEGCRNLIIGIYGCSNVKFINCRFVNSKRGLYYSGSSNVSCEKCEIAYMNYNGAYITGGELSSLKQCGHVFTDCRIHDVGEIAHTYEAGINIFDAIGAKILKTRFYNMPHSAILFSNPNCLVQDCIFTNCVNSSADAGVIYGGKKWSRRGLVVNRCYFYNIRSKVPKQNITCLYMDDCMCGATLSNCIFNNVQEGMFVGGGRDNTITNCLFVNCSRMALMDGRAQPPPNQGWAYSSIMSDPSWDLYGELAASPYRTDTWRAAFPKLYSILDAGRERALFPEGNKFTNLLGSNIPENISFQDNTAALASIYGVNNKIITFPEWHKFNHPDVAAILDVSAMNLNPFDLP